MGSLFDMCASRKFGEPTEISVDSGPDRAFLRRYPNTIASSVLLPSGLRVPPGKWGKEWVIQGDSLVLQRRSQEEAAESKCILLVAPNDVGFGKGCVGKVCSGKTLPSGFKVPEARGGREWVFDGEAVVLR